MVKQKKFDPEGTGYDSAGSAAAGYPRMKPNEHQGSFDPRTGRLLKGIRHKSIHRTVEAEAKRGNEIVKEGKDYYTRKKKKKRRSLEDL